MSRTYKAGNNKQSKPGIYKQLFILGPSGINCNCCTKGYHPTQLKVVSHRLYRRTIQKQLVKEQLNDLTENNT